MAKVLACPACGFKHPLDLLVGLDSFMCKDCGKKLAVPTQALPLVKTPKKTPTKIPTTTPAKTPTESVRAESAAKSPAIVSSISPVDVLSEQHGDVLVVARSSLAADAALPEQPSVVSSTSKISDSTSAIAVTVTPDADVLPAEDPQNANAKSPAKKPAISIPFFGRLVGWIISIPAGFVLVVLLPRFFGYGFHASDFVGVITQPGLGRYKIVVVLIFLWSIATVICVTLCNGIIRRLFHARKVA